MTDRYFAERVKDIHDIEKRAAAQPDRPEARGPGAT